MTEPTAPAPTRRLIEVDTKLRAATGRSLERWLVDQRAAKISWVDAAYEIRRLTEVRVSYESLRTWAVAWGIE